MNCRIILALALSLPAAALAQGTNPSANPSPYGVCGHHPGADILDAMKQAGIGWVRVDFNWFQMEPSRGVYDWRATDRVVQDSVDRGMGVFATLAYTPAWANGGHHHSAPPTDPADWVRFVEAVVTRYRGKVAHWGLWNEPNLDHFWTGSRDGYIHDILIPGADAVKRADPAAQVLGPELAHLKSGKWNTWLADVLRQAGSKIDIITHHIYKEPRSAFRTLDGFTWFWDGPNVKSVIDRNGGQGKPVWITETGWTTARHGEQGQAQRLEEWLDLFARRSWLKKVFYFHAYDGPSGTDSWGLLRPDKTPRPSLAAYARFIAAHPPGGPPIAPPPPGPITYPPPAGPWTFEAEALSHDLGRADRDGWSATTALDARGYMVFGPYTTAIPPGRHTASYRFMIDVTSATNNEVLTVDVYDANARRTIARRTIRRREFNLPGVYQEFTLAFDASPGQLLEFRTYWHDTAWIRQDRVTVR